MTTTYHGDLLTLERRTTRARCGDRWRCSRWRSLVDWPLYRRRAPRWARQCRRRTPPVRSADRARGEHRLDLLGNVSDAEPPYRAAVVAQAQGAAELLRYLLLTERPRARSPWPVDQGCPGLSRVALGTIDASTGYRSSSCETTTTRPEPRSRCRPSRISRSKPSPGRWRSDSFSPRPRSCASSTTSTSTSS